MEMHGASYTIIAPRGVVENLSGVSLGAVLGPGNWLGATARPPTGSRGRTRCGRTARWTFQCNDPHHPPCDIPFLAVSAYCARVPALRATAMFAVTPKKLVHWALDASLSDLASPFSEAPSSQSCSSTSSLQYVNSQLIAHGFVHDEGLSLEGLGKQDVDRVVKCLLGMLSQRVVCIISH